MSTGPEAEGLAQLRAEIALLRRAIEGLAAQQPEAAPDYTPTLGRILKLAGEVDEKLETLAEAPALRLTPGDIAGQLQTHVANARAAAHLELAQAISALGSATRLLHHSTGQVRTAHEHRRRLVMTGLAGAIGGLLIWSALFGPALRALPTSWKAPERMAAAILGRDRWAAGELMMAGADPSAWARLRASQAIVTRNVLALEACGARAERTGKTVSCEIRIAAEAQTRRPGR